MGIEKKRLAKKTKKNSRGGGGAVFSALGGGRNLWAGGGWVGCEVRGYIMEFFLPY